MTKKEILWREILHQTIENKKTKFTQKELAAQFGFSLSTVFNALKIPRQSGAIKVSGRNFSVTDSDKFLNIWATFRRLKKDIIYQTHCDLSVCEIEGLMPPDVIFGAFGAYVRKYKEAPADYDKVYIYLSQDRLPEIKKRFPLKKGYENLIVLGPDDWLAQFGQITPDVQTYVDLWNLSEWYAKDFLKALKEKMLI
jgi:hypothetical protein